MSLIGKPFLSSLSSSFSSNYNNINYNNKYSISFSQFQIFLLTSSNINLETGGSLWEGSVSLSNFIFNNKNLFSNKVILELGSGCGLSGISSSIIGGAKLVILTDLPQQISHLQENVDLNRHQLNCEVICVPFSFGETIDDLIERLKSISSTQVQNLFSNLSDSNTNFPIDCIIGADIGYDVSLLKPLTSSIYSLMSSNSSCICYFVEAVRWKDIYKWYLESIVLENQEEVETEEDYENYEDCNYNCNYNCNWSKYKNKMKRLEELEEREDNEENKENKIKEKIKPLVLEEVIVLYDKDKSIGINDVVIHSINEDESMREEGEINSFSQAPVHLHIFKQ